jgi:serine protease Do
MINLLRPLVFMFFVLVLPTAAAADQLSEVIDAVKPSVVGIGSLQRTRSPALSFIGTGFVIDDGLAVITAAHVIADLLNGGQGESLGILVRNGDNVQFRPATVVALDSTHDVARLRIDGAPLPALRLGDSNTVREGKSLAFTGFPLGMVLGLHHVTHRCTVSAITPVATPPVNARQLDSKLLSQLQKPAYAVFQLDGTAYPGSSGSPLFDPDTGQVIGIVNMVFVKGVKETAISTPSGITYAIPSNFITRPAPAPVPVK